MNCFLCSGEIKNELKTFMLEIDNSIIIIKNVPSNVCSQCGEISYDLQISKKLEEILDKLSPIVDGIAVFEYSKVLTVA